MTDQSDAAKVTKTLPLLPLRGILVFPYMVIHLDVGREKSVKAIEETMVQDRIIFLLPKRKPRLMNREKMTFTTPVLWPK